MKIKRYRYIFFTAALLFLILSVKTASAASGTCGDNLTWDLSGNVLTISGTGDMYDYTISGPWQSYNSSIKYIVVGDGVTYIGKYAFARLNLVKEAVIADSVTDIGMQAFYCCSKLESVNLPANLAPTRSTVAFSYCDLLLTAGPTGSGCNIEYGWTEEIPRYAFRCNTLTSITIGSSINYIHNNAFVCCNSLAEFTVQSGSDFYSAEDGVLYNKSKTKLILFPTAKDWDSFTIPDNVTSIAQYAVYDYTYWSSTVNPEGTINSYLFYFKNWALQANNAISGSWELEEGTVGIGDWAFSMCDYLEEIIIPDSVKRISEAAFYGCTGLSSVQLGNRTEEIGLQSFERCSGLTEITLPDSLKILGEYAFCASGLKNVEIPASVEEIGDCAFFRCEDLTEATILCKEAYIDSSTFEKCSSLEYIYCYKGSTADNADLYPEGVTIIYLDDGEAAKGDVNGDDSVNELDVVYILKDITNLVSLSDEEKAAADVNGDGNVDILDTIEILKGL
ncbi:MAG: leucine-rich repeat protein [Clostridiales bacterium]|nr:leucine-rich repeat protein [Clostridiales bacterium]